MELDRLDGDANAAHRIMAFRIVHPSGAPFLIPNGIQNARGFRTERLADDVERSALHLRGERPASEPSLPFLFQIVAHGLSLIHI